MPQRPRNAHAFLPRLRIVAKHALDVRAHPGLADSQPDLLTFEIAKQPELFDVRSPFRFSDRLQASVPSLPPRSERLGERKIKRDLVGDGVHDPYVPRDFSSSRQPHGRVQNAFSRKMISARWDAR